MRLPNKIQTKRHQLKTPPPHLNWLCPMCPLPIHPTATAKPQRACFTCCSMHRIESSPLTAKRSRPFSIGCSSSVIASRHVKHRDMMRFTPCPSAQIRYERRQVGLWRSLVARPSGGRKVAGSSPASPTIQNRPSRIRDGGRFCMPSPVMHPAGKVRTDQ